MLLPLAALWSMASAAPPAPPLDASVRWRRGAVTLRADGGPGEHLAPDGPATVAVTCGDRQADVQLLGAALVQGVALPCGAGPLSAQLDAVVCEDGGTRCRPHSTAFQPTTLAGKKGEVALQPVARAEPGAEAPAPLALTTQAAFERATQLDKLVLIDFGAVWCPPCNLLSAEVLHAPDPPEALAGFVVAEVDVDAQESWPAKDRYGVGGYPTLLAARPDGTEIDRLVGYPGRDAVVAWLQSVPGLPALGALPDFEELPADRLLALAERLAAADRAEDAERALAAAEDAGARGAALHRARLVVRDDADAAIAWLQTLSSSHPALWDALGLALERDDVAAALRGASDRLLPTAAPVQAADLLYIRGRLADDRGAAGFFAAGAAALGAALTGQPEADKGHLTSLAELQERAGQPELALRTLRDAARQWPEEFTFHHALARTLLAQDRADEAQASARLALRHGYGDNRLRAAHTLARTLNAGGDRDAALAVVREALARAPRPDDGADVRTFRYLAALEALEAGWAAEAASP